MSEGSPGAPVQVLGVDDCGDAMTASGEMHRLVTQARGVDDVREAGARIGHGEFGHASIVPLKLKRCTSQRAAPRAGWAWIRQRPDQFPVERSRGHFRVDARVADGVAVQLWPVYEAVFGDFSDYQTWRSSVWDKHSVRDGFRLARAYDGDALVGFAYGYTGERGSGGPTTRSRSWTPEWRRHGWAGTSSWSAWVCSPLPGLRGPGTGRGLMRALLRGLPHSICS